MKIKSDFVCHSMGSEHVVVAVGERTKEFRGMIRLNSTGKFLWDRMTSEFTEQSLIDALVAQYGITEELARKAETSFVETLSGAGVIEQ